MLNTSEITLAAKWAALDNWSPLKALKRTSENKWLIKGVIPTGSINWMVAPPTSFKTFLALDMGTCVASGRDWHGRETEKAVVVYLCAEGGDDVQIRRAAADMAAEETGPLCIVQLRPRLDEPHGLASLLALVDSVSGGLCLGIAFPEVKAFQDVAYHGKGYLTPDEIAAVNVVEKIDTDEGNQHQRQAYADSVDMLKPLGFDADNRWFDTDVPGYRNLRARFNAWDEAMAQVREDVYADVPSGFACKNVFLVVDTYSQTSADDSKPTVSRYIKTLRDLQDKAAARGGCVTVLVVDHTTKSGDSYMGSLAKEGDSDTMMEVQRYGQAVTIKCAKMKTGVPFEPIHVELKPITLDGFIDAYGDPLASLYVGDGEQSHKIRKAAGVDKDTATALVLTLLLGAGVCTREELREQFIRHEVNQGKNEASVKRAFNRALVSLSEMDAVAIDAEGMISQASDLV
jgi:hypothetical protein